MKARGVAVTDRTVEEELPNREMAYCEVLANQGEKSIAMKANGMLARPRVSMRSYKSWPGVLEHRDCGQGIHLGAVTLVTFTRLNKQVNLNKEFLY